MSELFKNRFRTQTTRRQDWNYAWPGLYFVTICVKDRKCCFGEIRDGFVYLSDIGKIIFEEWIKTSQMRPNVLLADWIIMPNHLHGIIEIKDMQGNVETHCNVSLHPGVVKNTFGPQKNNLSSIIRGFKGTCTKRINEIYGYKIFQWQSKFYDHIIRDEDDLARVKDYIAFNPENWQFDKNNPQNLQKKEPPDSI